MVPASASRSEVAVALQGRALVLALRPGVAGGGSHFNQEDSMAGGNRKKTYLILIVILVAILAFTMF
ncbi:MAG: hypothetical protein ACWGON_11760 [Gemmatimonadota bacterium]